MTTRKMMKRTGLLFAATLLALVVFSGVALAATISCEALLDCYGTKQADTMNGSDDADHMYGKGRGDTLNGLGGSDMLYGQGGADKLFGGPNFDLMVGGPGNDTLSGGEDSADRYYFYTAWGKDAITDDVNDTNQLSFLEGPDSDEDGVSDEDLIIKLASADGPEVKNASGTSTVNWEGNAIAWVYPSGSGDDQITGNSYANVIDADTGGADNISTGFGDDRIDVADGVGDDVVDCGESGNFPDDDVVESDSGDQIADNCERIQH